MYSLALNSLGRTVISPLPGCAPSTLVMFNFLTFPEFMHLVTLYPLVQWTGTQTGIKTGTSCRVWSKL